MTEDASIDRKRLLYLTAAQITQGDKLLSIFSRLAIGILSRNFDVSIAVVGAATPAAMNRLREDLGASRITGGFEPSKADRKVDQRVRSLMKSHHGSSLVNARLQRVVQQMAKHFDGVVLDAFAAWPYRPVSDTPVVFLLDGLETARFSDTKLMGIWQRHRVRDYKLEVLNTVASIYAPRELALELSHQGVPMRSLRGSLSRPSIAAPTMGSADFHLTEARIGYSGYLADDSNLASLYWFLDEVWPSLKQTIPKIEFHIAGRAPQQALYDKIASDDAIVLHGGMTDRALLDARCRLIVEPLLYEGHVDAKLISGMARGLPVITTQHALSRGHLSIQSGVKAAPSAEDMVVLIEQLMSESKGWQSLVDTAAVIVQEQLNATELVHQLRRDLLHNLSASGAGE